MLLIVPIPFRLHFRSHVTTKFTTIDSKAYIIPANGSVVNNTRKNHAGTAECNNVKINKVWYDAH